MGGEYRGRMIDTPEEGTVPTKNIARIGIANALSFSLRGARVLDLFAGSGAFGIELLSRGASSCAFVDNSPEAVKVTRNNLEKLKIPTDQVYFSDFRSAIERFKEPFDIVFLDPPYKERGFYKESLELLSSKGLLKGGGTLVLEYEGEEPEFPKEGFEVFRNYHYGRTRVVILRYKQ